mmetsp:Transcript_48302/g.122569  ORF Transcript_48302/g.122569 Transcript_48302/m.122569 type:complete len:203 (-) Transcript_48302:577-1185(-)
MQPGGQQVEHQGHEPDGDNPTSGDLPSGPLVQVRVVGRDNEPGVPHDGHVTGYPSEGILGLVQEPRLARPTPLPHKEELRGLRPNLQQACEQSRNEADRHDRGKEAHEEEVHLQLHDLVQRLEGLARGLVQRTAQRLGGLPPAQRLFAAAIALLFDGQLHAGDTAEGPAAGDVVTKASDVIGVEVEDERADAEHRRDDPPPA